MISRAKINLPPQNYIFLNQRKFWHIFKIGVLVLVFYIPFGVALNLNPQIDLALIRILILAFFLIWLVAAAFFKKRLFISPFQGFGLLSILAVSVASLLFAQEFSWGARKIAVFLSIFPLYFLVASIADEKSSLKKLTNIFIASTFISASIALIQFLAQFFISFSALIQFYSQKIGPSFWGKAFSALVAQNPSWFVNVGGKTLMRAFGLFPDPHMLAFFIGLGSPLLLATLLFQKGTNLKLFCVYVLMVVALFLTFSRGGYFGLFFSVFIVLLYSWRYLKEKKKFLITAISILFLLVLIIFGQAVISRFTSSFLISEGSSLGRLEIWQQSFKIFLEKPIFGVGLGNYSKTVDPLSLYRSPITSHNLYLDIASETGIFGLAAWLLLFFGSFYQLAKSLKRRRIENDEIKMISLKIGLLGSLSYFLVHSFFETSIFNPTILAALMIIFALVSVSLKPAR